MVNSVLCNCGGSKHSLLAHLNKAYSDGPEAFKSN